MIKVSKKQLKEMINSAIKSVLKENEGLSEVETQLDDAVSILEMISQRIMSFPVKDEKVAHILPKVVEALEKIDGFLGKYVGLQEMTISRGNMGNLGSMSDMKILLRVKNDLMSVAQNFHSQNDDFKTKQAVEALKIINGLLKSE